jgi:hypothetical protein
MNPPIGDFPPDVWANVVGEAGGITFSAYNYSSENWHMSLTLVGTRPSIPFDVPPNSGPGNPLNESYFWPLPAGVYAVQILSLSPPCFAEWGPVEVTTPTAGEAPGDIVIYPIGHHSSIIADQHFPIEAPL